MPEMHGPKSEIKTHTNPDTFTEEWIESVGRESAGFLNYFENHQPDPERLWRELHEITPGGELTAVELLRLTAQAAHGEFVRESLHITEVDGQLFIYEAPRSLRRSNERESLVAMASALYSTAIPIDPDSRRPIICANGHTDAIRPDGTLEYALVVPSEKSIACAHPAEDVTREIVKAFRAIDEAYDISGVRSYTL